jgi:hypothetical protein
VAVMNLGLLPTGNVSDAGPDIGGRRECPAARLPTHAGDCQSIALHPTGYRMAGASGERPDKRPHVSCGSAYVSHRCGAILRLRGHGGLP